MNRSNMFNITAAIIMIITPVIRKAIIITAAIIIMIIFIFTDYPLLWIFAFAFFI